MKLNELNEDVPKKGKGPRDFKPNWTKSQLNLLFKAAKSDQPAFDSAGNIKTDVSGKPKPRSFPLTTQYGQQRAVRDSDGKIVGAGGEMHDPIDPSTARSLLRKYAGEKAAGIAPRYGELPDRAYTWDALRNRDRRSAPGRPASWKDGETKDQRSALQGKRRLFVTKDLKRITANRPPRQKSGPKGSDAPATSINDPATLQRVADKRKARRDVKQMARQELARRPKQKFRIRKKGKRKGKKGPGPLNAGFDRSKSINEDFLDALDDSLGL